MSAYIGVRSPVYDMINSLTDGDFFKTVQGAQGSRGTYALLQSTSTYVVKSPEYRQIKLSFDVTPVEILIKVDNAIYFQDTVTTDDIILPTPILDNFTLTVSDVSLFSSPGSIAFMRKRDGKAHNISKAYIGISTEKTKDVPRQETTTTTKTISCTVNDANTASQYKKLSDLFTITNGSDYYFANNNTESTNNYSTYKSNNGGHSNTTASTTLTALHDFSALSFGYSYSGESNYDYVTLTVGGTTIESKASGSTTNKTWSGTLSKGQTIEITFTKDGSYDRYDDCGTIYNIQATYQATVTETTTVIDKVGTGEYANLARKIKAIFIGDENNKAQQVFPHFFQFASYLITDTKGNAATTITCDFNPTHVIAYVVNSKTSEYQRYLCASNFISDFYIESMSSRTGQITIVNNIITIPKAYFYKTSFMVLAWREE